MTTRIITLRAIDLMPDIATHEGGIPFRWLESLVQKVRALVPDNEEPTCMAHNADRLAFSYEHILTEVEQLQDALAALRFKSAQICALMPPEGSLTADQTQMLREILK